MSCRCHCKNCHRVKYCKPTAAESASMHESDDPNYVLDPRGES